MFCRLFVLVFTALAGLLATQNARYDSRYFKHGSQKNEIDGGTCAEFLQLNKMPMCCDQRDDDCFMIHYDSRCYCDIFCYREAMNDHSDCCPDADKVCNKSHKQEAIQGKADFIENFLASL